MALKFDLVCGMDLGIQKMPQVGGKAAPDLASAKKQSFHRRSEIHLARKLWHASTVSLMALTYALAPTSVSMFILATAGTLFLSVDFLRQRWAPLNEVMLKLFKPFIRDSEVRSIAGTTYLLVGVIISVAFFPQKITLLTIWLLAFADPVASYVGIRYGKRKVFGHKSWAGAYGAFFVCAVIGAIFFKTEAVYSDFFVFAVLGCGVIGSLSELIPIGKLDDNLSFPVLSSVMLFIFFSLLNSISSAPLMLTN